MMTDALWSSSDKNRESSRLNNRFLIGKVVNQSVSCLSARKQKSLTRSSFWVFAEA